MNDYIEGAPSSERLASIKQITLVIYVLYAVGLFTGTLTSIVAIIINYVKREDARGTLYESHFTWQIRTFWWSLLWGLVGWATVWLLGLGFIVWAADLIWVIYRLVKGFLNWSDGKPMPVA